VNPAIQQIVGLLLLLIMTTNISRFIVENIEVNGIIVMNVIRIQVILAFLVVLIVMNTVIRHQPIEIIEV